MNKKTYHRLTIITLALTGMLVFPVSSFGAEKLVVKDGLGTTQFRVLDDGSVGIGIAPTSKLHVNSYEATQDIQGSRFSYTTEATAGYGNIGLFSEATSAPAVNSIGEVYALQGIARTAYGSTVNHGGIFGLRFTAQHRGTGYLGNAYGVNAYPYNGSTGTINNAYGLYTLPWMADGTINNWYGVFVGNQNLGLGTVGNLYGIYIQEPSADNFFAGTIHMGGGAWTDGNDWYPASSRELKENIKDVNSADAIKTLTALKPVEFNYKNSTEETHIGFIAEEVPDLVAMNDRKSLSTMDITAVLTKVVQEQQKMIEELKDKIAELETEMQFKKDKDASLASADLAR